MQQSWALGKAGGQHIMPGRRAKLRRSLGSLAVSPVAGAIRRSSARRHCRSHCHALPASQPSRQLLPSSAPMSPHRSKSADVCPADLGQRLQPQRPEHTHEGTRCHCSNGWTGAGPTFRFGGRAGMDGLYGSRARWGRQGYCCHACRHGSAQHAPCVQPLDPSEHVDVRASQASTLPPRRCLLLCPAPRPPLTQLEGGQEPGRGEDVEGRLVEDVEHNVEGVPAK